MTLLEIMRAARPGSRGCPTPAELGELVSGKGLDDPWGHPYLFRCSDLPPEAQGIAVWSSGANGKDEQGEGDDIASWKK